MRITYVTQRLHSVLQSISALTGVSISFLTPSYEVICSFTPKCDFCSSYQAEFGCEHCNSCDRQLLFECRKSGNLEERICHMGLYDAAMPVIKNGITVGYILMRRLRTENLPKNPLCSASLAKVYGEIPFFGKNDLRNLRNLLSNILFSDAFLLETDTLFEEACDYIEKNYKQRITVNEICKHLGISKNRLYKSFKEAEEIAVNEYIIKVRLKKAKELLADTKKTVSDIAEETGMHSEAYFCRIFKLRLGYTPTEYRKSLLNKATV